MESQRNRDKEGMFFALEKNSRRRCGEITGVAKLIDLGYEWGSLYGLRILRPLMWLIGGIGVSALLLTGVWAHSAAGGPAGGVIFTQAFGDALLFSAKQSFLPFDALRAEKLDYVFNPYGTGWLRVLGFFQTLYSALCILLLILAVRWRYRR